MRRIRWILFLCSFICFAGCAMPEKPEESIWRVTAEDYVPASEWPENDYTARIPRPESGQVEYINDWSLEGKFGVWLTDLSKKDSDQYVEQLKEAGYLSTAYGLISRNEQSFQREYTEEKQSVSLYQQMGKGG